jgi:hypothetical protein
MTWIRPRYLSFAALFLLTLLFLLPGAAAAAPWWEPGGPLQDEEVRLRNQLVLGRMAIMAAEQVFGRDPSPAVRAGVLARLDRELAACEMASLRLADLAAGPWAWMRYQVAWHEFRQARIALTIGRDFTPGHLPAPSAVPVAPPLPG